jgi:hypothetical protein
MHTRSHNPLLLIPALVGVLWLVGPVHAQQAAGGGGRALDANPQQGSGGVNRPENVIDFRARNNIVTGNVTDFRQFRGNVGYSAPGEFGERLGSDDLFRFRADSFSSGRTQLNAASINRDASNLSLNVYSTVSQVPGFTYRQSPMSSRSLASEGGGFQLYNPVFRPPSATGLITEPIAGDIRDTGTSIGMIEVPDGRTLEVTASPLLGLRRTAIPDFATTPLDDAQRQRNEAGRLEAERRDELDFGVSSRLDTRVEGMVTDPSLGEAGPLADRPGRVEPTLLLGRAIQSRVNARRGDVPANQTLEDQVERIERRIFSPLGNRNVEPGKDVYLDLLREMRQRDEPVQPDRPGQSPLRTDPQRAQGDGDEEGAGAGEDDGMGRDDPFDPGALEPLRRGLEGALDEPEDEQLRKAEREAREARRNRLGVRLGEGEGEERDSALLDADDPVAEMLRKMERRNQLRGDDPEARADAEQAQRDRALGELLETLSRDTPMVGTLAGQQESRRNTLLAKAENELAEGRYFAAEQIYRQLVRTGDESTPLAQVGLVHAQLAAGMIRSAGLNVRRLFEQHPELIGVRYEANLLPPPDRIEKIQQELQRSINADAAGPDPGLLLGYLGFQAGSERVVRYGLSVAEAEAPRDPLIPVLRGVWLQRLDAGQGADAPAESADDTAEGQSNSDASGRSTGPDTSTEPAGK